MTYIKTLYAPHTSATQSSLLNQLQNLWYTPGEGIVVYHMRARSLYEELQASGEPMSERMFVHMFMQNLPPDFTTVLAIIEAELSNPAADFTFSCIITMLRNREEKLRALVALRARPPLLHPHLPPPTSSLPSRLPSAPLAAALLEGLSTLWMPWLLVHAMLPPRTVLLMCRGTGRAMGCIHRLSVSIPRVAGARRASA
eukprot:351703-Chlamydomonas_euryale.AAC.5